MLEKSEVYKEVNQVLNQLLGYSEDHIFEKDTNLIGEKKLLNSLIIVRLLTWCDEYYHIDLIEDDLTLDYLSSMEAFVTKIYELCHKGDASERI